jgi:hypothetical protein
MTNDDIVKIFKTNSSESFIAALRGVYNAGYYEGAGLTPTATSVDQSKLKSKPTAVVSVKHSD